MNKNDLQLLGLEPNATLEDVEKKYERLLFKQRALEREGALDEKQQEEFEKITEAYDRLTNRVVTKKSDDPEKNDRGVWFTGFNKESLENFFYLYKWQFWGGIIGVILVVSLVFSIVTREDPDFNIAYIGDLFVIEEHLTEYISEEIPEIEEISYTETQMYGVETFIARFVTAELDFVLVQESLFHDYACEGYFMNLDEIAKNLNIKDKYTQDFRVIVKHDEKKEEHIYGINADHLEVLQNKMGYTDEGIEDGYVIAIPHNTKRLELAQKLLEVLY